MNDHRFSRNSTLIPTGRLNSVGVYGLGGIGSALVQMLSIMGFESIIGFDHDTFELHNASTTAYPMKLLDAKKAMCATIIANDYGCENANFKSRKWTSKLEVEDCIISAVDSMDVRKALYEAWLARDTREWFIDTRMGGMSYEVITVTKITDNYMSTWKPADKISDEVCTARHTIFTAFAVASEALSQVQKLVAKLPFFTYIWRGLDITELKKEGFTIENTISEETV